MSLRTRVVLSSLLLLALLAGTGAAVVIELRRQAAEVEAIFLQFQTRARLAGELGELYERMGYQALAYGVDRNRARLDAIAGEERYAARTIAAYLPRPEDGFERALLDGVAEMRKRAVASRGRYLAAVESADPRAAEAAFERWYIHRTLLIAHLADLSSYSAERLAVTVAAQQARRERLARNVLLGLAMAIAIAVGGFFYARSAINRSLGALARHIDAFGSAKPGHESSAPFAAHSEEIGAVARSFDRMAGQLEDANTTLEERVRERTAQLEAANRELEAFAYSVSHDLRAPLRAIDGFSQALLEDYEAKLDEEGKDYLRRVRAASQKMGGLIDDMLKLSRATRGDMELGDVNLSDLAASVANDLRSEDPARAVEVKIEPGIVARGDARLLRVVLENLLSNAWKFTARAPAPRIEFGCERAGAELVCRVRDNGAGFDMAHVGALFAPFQRLHRATEFPGNGIGLATVKRVIARMGGRVWAEGAVGAGATFYFTLPLGAGKTEASHG